MGGGLAKSMQIQTGRRGVKLKVDSHLEKNVIPYFLKYTQSDNLPDIC